MDFKCKLDTMDDHYNIKYSTNEEELWEVDPNCNHNIVSASGGGVRCTKCGRLMSYDPYFKKMICRICNG